MTTLETTQAALTSFDSSVTRVEEAIRPLLTAVQGLKNDDSVPALTKARIYATLAYAVNALYYIYLRAHNVSTCQLDEELHRVQSLFARLRTVERKHAASDEVTPPQLHGLRMAVEKLDAFLTPEEAALAHAVTGAQQPRQRHKRFSNEKDEDDDDEKRKTTKKLKRKKSVKVDDVEMPDVGDTNIKSTSSSSSSAKKKKKSKKKSSANENVETPSTKVEPNDVATPTGKKKRKSRKSKKQSDA